MISNVFRRQGRAPMAHPSEIRGPQTGDRGKEGKGEGSGQAAGDVTGAVLLRQWEEEWGQGLGRNPAEERGSVHS